MRFKIAIMAALLGLFSIPAWSQADQPQVDQPFEAGGIITANLQAQTSASGVTDRATYSGGALLNLRYHFRGRLWFEANGGFTTFTQYYEPIAEQEQANIWEGTAALVYKFRDPDARLKPFVEGGGGVLYFSPVVTGSTPGGSKVMQPAGVGGFGVDWKMDQNFSFRAGYRVMVYKPASFKVASQTVNTITTMSEPYIGLVLRF